MARGARRPAQYRKLTPYEWRVFSRTGMLPSEARARGISLAAARGHAPRAIEPGGERIPEHRLRDIRRRLRGEPTEAERRWLRKQWAAHQHDPGWSKYKSYEDVVNSFMAMDEYRRDKTREYQTRAERLYRSSHSRWRWNLDAPEDWGQFPGLNGPDDIELMFYH